MNLSLKLKMGTRHYNQSKSDLFRVGISPKEDQLAEALEYWTNALRQYDLCFTCGRYSERLDETQFASYCRNPSCRKKYNSGMGQHCQPDFIIVEDNKKAVIFVNGEDHDKKEKRRHLDKYQIIRLSEFGYKVFILKNIAIGNLYQMNLIALMKTIVEATKDDQLYRKMIAKEKDWHLLPLLYGC
jgi:hypothetical protein